MAGPMTHMMVSQVACDSTKVTTIDQELQDLLLDYQPFLLLGSVGPDLPAIDDAIMHRGVSDRMHEGSPEPRIPTNTTVRALYTALKRSGRRPDCAPFAFLLGWQAHVDTDLVVHPVVNIVVEEDKRISHRECETYQDALLFDQYMHQNIKRNDYLRWLEMCNKQPEGLSDTLAVWQPIVNQYYGGHDCRQWISRYETAFSIARQLIHIDGWSYPSPAEIKDYEVKRCYSEVILPVTRRPGQFERDVFWRAVNCTAQRWQRIYERFLDPGDHHDIEDLVPDSDLNTGKNMTTGQPLDLWR